MLENEKAKIEKELRIQGFPLEIEVGLLLKRRGWKVIHQPFYVDEDSGKGRLGDLWAIKAFHSKEKYDLIHFSLIIECKKSEKPWVFYVTEKEPLEWLALKYWSKTQRLEWAHHSHYNDKVQKENAVVSFEPFKGKNKEDIYEASMQVLKCAQYKLNNLASIFKDDKFNFKNNPFFLIYPVIVFDGHLWEYKFKDIEYDLSETNYLQYCVEQKESSLIDIVKKENLVYFLDLIEKEYDSIIKTLNKSI